MTIFRALTMKSKIYILIIILVNYQFVLGQKEKNKINQIVSALEKVHISPLGINDEMSIRIYSEFIDAVDPMKLIFLQSDIEKFKKYELKIDDEIKSEDYKFFNFVLEKYILRLNQVDSLTKSLVLKPINLHSNLSIKFNSEKKYASNLSLLSEKWQKWINYEVLQIMYASYPSLDLTNKDSVLSAVKFASLKQKTETDCWLYSYGLGDNKYIETQLMHEFLESIALAYDPHSSYFTEEIKKSFDIALSKEAKEFGINFIKEEGVFKISSMNPGSSAWKSNLLNIDDVIYKIVDDNKNEIELNCIDEYDLEDALLSPDINTILLTVIKKSGEKVDVELDKQNLEIDENIMTAILLEGPKKIGYISIPSFYTSWEGNAAGCTNDVAKEILKLKKENIEGLIIDLRFNGGGSIKESVDLAGIFIDSGPLAIMASAEEKPFLLKDFNKGRVYSDPLVVMINGASASASEMFSGAMQSYNRAVIVGSPSFGKSTGQVVLPIDTNYWNTKTNNVEPTDFVKVTIHKVYNVKNGSHQETGIIPDIAIPDIWDYYIPTEADEHYFIPNDSIVKKIYLKPYPTLPLSELQSKSQQRIIKDTLFTFIEASNDSIKKELSKEYYIPLNINEYWEYISSEDENYENWKQIMTNFTSNLTIKNLEYNSDIEKMDERFAKRSKQIFKHLKKDKMLNEAYLILNDLIEIQNK